MQAKWNFKILKRSTAKRKKHYDEDEAFAEKARNYVVKLQGGDEYCPHHVEKLVDITMQQNQRNYDRLNVDVDRKRCDG